MRLIQRRLVDKEVFDADPKACYCVFSNFDLSSRWVSEAVTGIAQVDSEKGISERD